MRNKKYTGNKKNGGNVPVLHDKRVSAVSVGCQKCIECRKQKARGWTVRLQEEVRENKNGKYVTLTFSNDSLKELIKEIDTDGYERENDIATLAVRRFLERWRKKYKVSVRHWLITELGGGRYEHLHIHGIIFTDEVEDIKKIWGYGFVYIGRYVNNKTINYIAKYVNKVDELHKEYMPKVLASKGIGSAYIKRMDAKGNRYKEEGETRETYVTREGTELALPTYYRNLLYNEEEKERLWIQKLDKMKRYVLGQEIDISNGYDEYNRAIKMAREKNNRLGYGSDGKKYDQDQYENERRNLLMEERLGRGKSE